MHSARSLAPLILSLAVVASGCRSERTGTAQFAVSSTQTLTAGSVTRVTVTSSGPDILSVTTDLVKTGGIWGGVIGNLPAGSNRTFLAQAFDSAGTLLFEGSTGSVTITADQTTLVAITLQEVNPPQPFSNEAPIIQSVVASPTTVQTGGSISLQSIVQDPNAGDSISYAWTGPGSFANPTHPGTSWTAPSTVGLVTLTLTVSDTQGASSAVTLPVNVVNGSGEGSATLDVQFNVWPVVTALTVSPTSLEVGQSTTATVTASDGDGDSLTYQWASTCAGTWTNATSITASFSPSVAPAGACNNCQLTVTVADGRGGQSTGTIALCVATAATTHFPPAVIRSYRSSLSAQPAQQLAFEVTVSDPQNSSLTFSWSAGAGTLGAAQSSADTSRVVWTAPSCAPAATSVSIMATVTNAYGLSVTRSFGVTGLPACAVSGWASAGPMPSPRGYHTAALLTDGKVLVAGGNDSSGTTTSAAVYDPATDTWAPTGSLSQIRWLHTETPLPNGQALVVGGSGAPFTAELYHPETGAWTLAAPMISGRIAHTATLLTNGTVLVVGGTDWPTARASAEVYDPGTGIWVPTGSLSTGRAFHEATLMPDGKVLVTGGMTNSGGGYLTSAEVYDPATGSWTATGSMASSRIGHKATVLPDGKVLVAGGGNSSGRHASAEVYDPATGVWASTGSMANARIDFAMTPLSNGRVIVAGGTNDVTYLTGAEVYDPGAGAWTSTSSMISPRWLHTATLLPSGQVLVVGGASPGGYTTSTEIFTP